MAAHAVMFGVEGGIATSLANEHLMATGAYQALKWAMEFAPDDGLEEVSGFRRGSCGSGHENGRILPGFR
jgi:hypothetical protein